ncbi:hypothetical protein [Rhizobium sp. BG4]|jgi:hypothetical protein|uniref:hypothetical protein n=1 Tax=unclassified Rhizobium TaxID=2613769 RepID=UPI0011D0B4BF|nr:hypothetical protein [Rhizobium sp. BG4]QRM47280.1 hypothetical protein F2982_28410 [Rhizobium sp. BG4]
MKKNRFTNHGKAVLDYLPKASIPIKRLLVNQILKDPVSLSTEKPAQLDAATRRSRLTSANRFWQNQYPPFEDSPAVESQAGGEVGLLSVVTSL